MRPLRRYITQLGILLLALTTLPTSAEDKAANAEAPTLTHRTERLEKSRGARGAERESRLNLVGAIEVDAQHSRDADGGHADITVSTVELGLDARLTSITRGHVLLLFEEDADVPIDIDEAIITVTSPHTAWSLAAGRLYIPFGQYGSALLSDPLTLELGETRESAIQLGWERRRLSAMLWIANGETHQNQDDALDLYGTHIHMAATSGNSELTIALSWLNNLADTDALQDAITQPGELRRRVPGAALYASIKHHDCTLITEQVAALRPFSTDDLGHEHAQPTATNLELDYSSTAFGKPTTLALARQQTADAEMLELPQTRWLATASIALDSHSTVGIEYRRDRQYSGQRANQSLLKLSTIF